MQVLGYAPFLPEIRVAPRPTVAPNQPGPADVFVPSQQDPLRESRQLKAFALTRGAAPVVSTPAYNALEFGIEHPNMGYTTLEQSYPQASPQDKARIAGAIGRYVASGGPQYTKDWMRNAARSKESVDRQAAYQGYGEMWKKGPLAQEDWNILAAHPDELKKFIDANQSRLGPEDRARLSTALSLHIGTATEGSYSTLRYLNLEPSAKDLRVMGPGLDQKTMEASRLRRWLEEKAKSPDQATREGAAFALLSSKLELDRPVTLAKIAAQSDDPEFKKVALRRLEGPISDEQQSRFDQDLSKKMRAYLDRRAGWLKSDKEKDPVFQLARNYWALSQSEDPKYRDHVDVKAVRANIGRLLLSPELQDLRNQAAIDNNLGLDKSMEVYRYVVSDALQVRLQLLPEGERTQVLARELGKLQQFNPQLAAQAAQELSASLAPAERSGLPGQPGEGAGLLSGRLAVSGAESLTKEIIEAKAASMLLRSVGAGMSIVEAYDSFSSGDIGGGVGSGISALGALLLPAGPVGLAVGLVGVGVTQLFGDSAEVAQLKSLGVYRG